MYNIWGFLLQTIAVSIVAGIILLLKKIFEDKLSPKWQYSIWALLAIRILVPVNLASYVVPQFALWTEMIKAKVEALISSTYSGVYQPITLHHIIPIVTKAPQSVTDYLFVIYMVGMVFFLLKYFIAYIRLHMLLRRGSKVSSEMEEKMLSVCNTYGLKACKMIAVNGVSSAFICGIIRPVLVIPAQCDVDEKVFLHELLHYKYYDTIQNIGWCILRSLHWCNPFIHLAVNQVENDMESMCDQRVLELLEGEERREYGNILLNMANQKYARIPGTTSISNGGNNISKRIASIVRFKKYPQGMALVSICIILILFWPTIIGTAATYDANDYNHHYNSIEKSMAIARVNRCGTVAGALDMYAKGVYQMNGAYVASASKFTEHARIIEELEEYGCYQPGQYVAHINKLYDFYIYNLDQIKEKEYTATICYHAEDSNGVVYIFLPVSITYDEGWCVEENGERWILTEEEYKQSNSFTICAKQYYGKNDIGEIKIELETQYKINRGLQNERLIAPDPNADFSYYKCFKFLTYTHLLEEKPRSYVEIYVNEMDTDDYFKPRELNFASMDHTEKGWHIFKSTTNWNGSIKDDSGGGYGGDDVAVIDIPSKYIVNWNIAGEEQEDIILQEVTD